MPTTSRQCHAVPVKAGRWPLVLAVLISAGLCSSCASVHRSGLSSKPSRTAATTSHLVRSNHEASTTVSIGGSATSAPLEEVSCVSVDVCIAVGAFGFSTPGHEVAALSTDRGARWAVSPPFDGVTHLDAMACATSNSCLAVGYNLVGANTVGVAVSTADGGRTWKTVSTLPRDVTELKSISCPSSTRCFVVGLSTDEDQGIALATDASGSEWHALSLPDGESMPSLVVCTSNRACAIEGTKEAVVGDPGSGESLSIFNTVNGGASWVPGALFAGTGPAWPNYKAIACPAPSRCILVGDASPPDGSPSGVTTVSLDAGQSWTAVQAPAGTSSLNAISCPTAVNCVVVGGGIGPRGGSSQAILTTTNGGQTWTSRTVPAEVTGLSAVSCPTTLSCVAVGFGPSSTSGSGVQPVVAATDDGGASWTIPG